MSLLHLVSMLRQEWWLAGYHVLSTEPLSGASSLVPRLSPSSEVDAQPLTPLSDPQLQGVKGHHMVTRG